MRKTSIISIIRRYGLNSKRLNRKFRIKYEDAIKMMTQYENSELRIVKVIDNVLYPQESVSKHCQIEGCGQAIRYEYVIENKQTHKTMVAGSTCVWPLLGFSELQKKEFLRLEEVIKERAAVLEWRDSNQDVLDKLDKLRQHNVTVFRPFWEEIEYSRLNDEDTGYIKRIDADGLIEKARIREELEEKRRIARDQALKEARERADAEIARMAEERQKREDEYSKVVEGLKGLVREYPHNQFYGSLNRQVESGRHLSREQIKHVKLGCNKMWYEKSVKGTARDIMDRCEAIIDSIKSRFGVQVSKDSSNEEIVKMEEVMAGQGEHEKLAWALFKVKNRLVAV